ncbi:hypothetical protein F2P81_016784 [Scophthalmus maximus]|uniref:Uncharacterized protein n=1 Tax=Scophthalmus maximus TaxID=52904 RepID=A0A6A4S6L0_SCOMX|nr:hypothetical protein F2P81_016784 [Scophthalmus maximus]
MHSCHVNVSTFDRPIRGFIEEYGLVRRHRETLTVPQSERINFRLIAALSPRALLSLSSETKLCTRSRVSWPGMSRRSSVYCDNGRKGLKGGEQRKESVKPKSTDNASNMITVLEIIIEWELFKYLTLICKTFIVIIQFNCEPNCCLTTANITCFNLFHKPLKVGHDQRSHTNTPRLDSEHVGDALAITLHQKAPRFRIPELYSPSQSSVFKRTPCGLWVYIFYCQMLPKLKTVAIRIKHKIKENALQIIQSILNGVSEIEHETGTEHSTVITALTKATYRNCEHECSLGKSKPRTAGY